jgi:hypothetical protein
LVSLEHCTRSALKLTAVAPMQRVAGMLTTVGCCMTMCNACLARYEYLIVTPKSSTFCCTLACTGPQTYTEVLFRGLCEALQLRLRCLRWRALMRLKPSDSDLRYIQMALTLTLRLQ